MHTTPNGDTMPHIPKEKIPTVANIVSYSPVFIAPIFLTLMLIFPALLIQAIIMIFTLYKEIIIGDSIADILVRVLEIVEICLGGSIVYIMLFSSIENFVTSLHLIDKAHCPSWMRHISLGEIKLKLMSTIITIIALDLVNHTIDSQTLNKWEMGIRVVVLTALSGATYLMAITENITQHNEEETKQDEEKNTNATPSSTQHN